LSGGATLAFISGIDSAFYASIVISVRAGILSFVRGKEARTRV
ncbi:MAG: hypothetical protein QG670_1006, partial [Thermoproteota archaeon]|nr:hypothetical protein [Thermoproteota archaeon]